MDRPSDPITSVSSHAPCCNTCGEYTPDPQSNGFRIVGSRVFCGDICHRTEEVKSNAFGISQRVASHYVKNQGQTGVDIVAVFKEERADIVQRLRDLATEYEQLPPVRVERYAKGVAGRPTCEHHWHRNCPSGCPDADPLKDD